MVQGKKLGEQTNGTTKHKDQQQSNMSFQRKDMSGSRGGVDGRNDGRSQNGNAGGFRTDSAISGGRVQGERVLQKWVPDAPAGVDNSLESSGLNSKGSSRPWNQFEENERRFGLKSDYDENIYTTTIDKSHPNYKQRLAHADRVAREIEGSTATNPHIAEERVRDNLTGDGGDEEDKYSGVRRQDFPPLTSSNNKYTPPARRAPTATSTVPGAPVDPAILSTARPEKNTTDKNKAAPVPAPAPAPVSTPSPVPASASETKAEASTPAPAPAPAAAAAVTATPDAKESKTSLVATPSSSSTIRKASPHTKTDGTPNATATVERDVLRDFKAFATQQKQVAASVRQNRARNDKEVKLNDLKKFANSFKLNTPVPSDLVSIIAKDPAKQKEITEKAKRNAEQAKANPAEAAKPMAPIPEPKPAARPAPTSHGASPANNANRQNTPRNQGFPNQGQYNNSQYRSSQGQQMPAQRGQPGNLGPRLRSLEQNKQGQTPLHPIPAHESRPPPTGPSNLSDPNFSRRSSGVTSAQGGRLNPNSSEFRPSPHAATFNPNGNPSSTSSPRSGLTASAPAPPPPSRERFMLKRKPIAASERPSLGDKFSPLEHIKTLQPPPEKNWKATGGLKPAYDTTPVWKTSTDADKPDAIIHLTYTKLFEMTPYPAQAMSPPHPSHAAPQVPHQHQLPFHLQHNTHNMMPRQSPRQPQMNMGNQHNHGPNQGYNGSDEHRMMPSQSAQGSFASPRMQNNVLAFPSPMNQPAQLAYNPAMQYGGPPMAFRSLSQSQQFIPQQGHMGVPPIMMQNPGPGFMAAQGMPPGPGMMYPPGGQTPFIPPGNGPPPAMPVNGYPSPGRGAPMMMSQGSQQGHQQQQQQMFPMNPGMSPGPQYPPMYPQQGPGQMPMRGYNNQPQYGTSPQQMHQFGNQHRNNHQNGNYNNNKNFQNHGQHPNGPPNNQIPTGPQARNSEGGEESK